VWQSQDELRQQWHAERIYHPTLSREHAAERMARWERAVRQTVSD
jgi:glycerol kinase